MYTRRYTLSQLTDLALKVPEIGNVNFNILHTVLKTTLSVMGIETWKPFCYIQNPVNAQMALTSMKLQESSPLKKSHSEELFKKGQSAQDLGKILSPVVTEEELTEQEEKNKGLLTSLGTLTEDKDGTSVSELTGEALREAWMAQRTQAPSGAAITSGIDSGEHSQIMSEMWRATNINRRMDAAEEGLIRLSYVVDHLVDKFSKVKTTTEEVQATVSTLAPEVHLLSDEVHTLKEFTPTKEEFEQIEIQTKKIQETKIDKADIAQLMQASWTEGKPEMLEDLEEKVEIIEDAMKHFMEETGISYQLPTVEEGKSELVSMPKDYEPPEILHIPSFEEEIVETKAPKTPKPTFKGVMLESEGGEKEEEIRVLEHKEVKEDRVKTKFVKPQKRPSLFKMKPPLASETSFGNRIEQLAKEIARIGRKLDNREEQELNDKRLETLERLFQKLNEEQLELKIVLSDLESVINAQTKKNEEFQNEIVDLQFNKTDRKELKDGLELKVDKSDMEGKLNREEFESAVADLGDGIDVVVAILAEDRKNFASDIAELERELKLKLNTADFEELQYPLNNRIRALLYGFKKMREIIQSTVYPEAAAVTKCISCGRQSQLAGAKYKDCGDFNAFQKYPHRREYLTNDSKPPDDQGGNNKRKPGNGDDTATTISIPESLTANNDQSQPSSAVLCHKCSRSPSTTEEKNQSKNNSTLQELGDSNRSMNYNQDAFQLNVKGVGLAKRKTKSEIDNELEKLCETSPKTRFCGGEHTKVQHKAFPAINMGLLQKTREKVVVLGYNKSYYHGTVAVHNNESSEQRHEVADRFKDLTDDELVTAFDEAFCALPQLHTNQNEEKYFTDVLDRALKFAPMRYTEDPVWRDSFQDCTQIKDSDEKSLSSERDSQGSNIPRKSKSDSGHIDGKTLLKPAIITMSADNLTGLSEGIMKNANQRVSEQLQSEQDLALSKTSDNSIKSGLVNKQHRIKKK